MRQILCVFLVAIILTYAQSIEAKKKSHHGKLKSLAKGSKLHPESSEDNIKGTKKQVLGLGGIGQNAGPPEGSNFGDEPVGSLGGALANAGSPAGAAGIAGIGEGEGRGFEGADALAAANGLAGGGPGGLGGLGGAGGLGPNVANALAGGLGGDSEGVPTGMGAGGEPLGFAGQGQGSPFGGGAGGGGLNDLGLGGGPSQEGNDNFDQEGGGVPGGLGGPLGGGLGGALGGAGNPDSPGIGEPVGNAIPASNFPNQGGDSSDTAALAREAVQDNNALGELVKNADKIQDDSPGDPPPEVDHADSASSVSSPNDDAAQLQNLASDEAAGFKSSQGDVEATSMNGAQAVLGMQGSKDQRSMKRYTLKKAKKGSKKSKHGKKTKSTSS